MSLSSQAKACISIARADQDEDAGGDADDRALDQLGDLLGHLGLGELDLLADEERDALGDVEDELADGAVARACRRRRERVGGWWASPAITRAGPRRRSGPRSAAAIRAAARLASALDAASIPAQSSFLTMSLSTAATYRVMSSADVRRLCRRASAPRDAGATRAERAAPRAVTGSRPPQIISTSISRARSNSSSDDGISSKTQPGQQLFDRAVEPHPDEARVDPRAEGAVALRVGDDLGDDVVGAARSPADACGRTSSPPGSPRR